MLAPASQELKLPFLHYQWWPAALPGDLPAAWFVQPELHLLSAQQIPGRMSDSAVAGAGAYADSRVGGCGSTGDGDIHLRFLPCYQVLPPVQQWNAV